MCARPATGGLTRCGRAGAQEEAAAVVALAEQRLEILRTHAQEPAR